MFISCAGEGGGLVSSEHEEHVSLGFSARPADSVDAGADWTDVYSLSNMEEEEDWPPTQDTGHELRVAACLLLNNSRSTAIVPRQHQEKPETAFRSETETGQQESDGPCNQPCDDLQPT